MDPVVLLAAAGGLVIGSLCNRIILREPGYVIRDPGDLPNDADPALLDELDPEPDVGSVPVIAVARPRTWTPRWLPVTEVVTAGLFATVVHRFGAGVTGAVVLVFVAALVVLVGVDIRVHRLPDRVNGPATAVALVLIPAASLYHGIPGAIGGAIAGGASYFLLLFLFHVVSPRGMGFGDVKLAFHMGLYLGWVGWREGPAGEVYGAIVALVLLGAFFGAALGVVIGMAYAAVRRTMRVPFPFGPSLAAGCLGVLLWAIDLSVRTL